MPRGSRRGEHRGNAKAKVQPDVNGIMREVLSEKRPSQQQLARTERRVIEARRTIPMTPHDVTQMTPRDVLLDNMHFYMQGAFDWQGYLATALSMDPPTKDSMEDVAAATIQIERFRRLASDDAYKVAPYIHPRLAAMVLGGGDMGQSAENIIQALLNDIDARQRGVIEHEPEEKPEDVS